MLRGRRVCCSVEYRKRDAKRTWVRVNQGQELGGGEFCCAERAQPTFCFLVTWGSAQSAACLAEPLVLWPPGASARYSPLVPW